VRKLCKCLVAIAAILFLSAVAHAQQRAISSFESDIKVNQDGSALIIESYEFPSSSGGFARQIATHLSGAIGNGTLFIDVATVSDDHGNDVAYYAKRSSERFTIRVPKLVGHRLQIAYRVRNAVQFGESNNDEFVWVANDPVSPVDSAAFHVSLPDAAAGQIRAQAFLRDIGISHARSSLWSFNGQIITSVTGSKVESVAPGPLVPGVGVVMHVSVPAGILTPPGMLTRAEWFLQANPVVFLPFGVLAIMFVVWRLKPRNPDPGMSVAPMYAPPEGLTPAEVGVLVDDSVDPRDVTATLIDLAVRGYVRLERTKPEHRAFGDREDYIVHLVKPREQWVGLKPHELTMMFHTFYGGQWTQLSSLRLRFPDIVPYMKISLFTTLKQQGMYLVQPENAVVWHQGALALIYLLIWAAPRIEWSVLAPMAESWGLTLISLIVSAAIVFAFGRKSSPKTLRGMRTYIAIRGFEEFIRTVEGDKLRRLEPDLFEKYLPYAMALGVEHRWTRAFEGIAIKQPEWFEMADELFSTVSLGHQLDSVFTTAILSAPRGRMPLPIATVFGNGAAIGKSAGL
jgi:hypothetical protein